MFVFYLRTITGYANIKTRGASISSIALYNQCINKLPWRIIGTNLTLIQQRMPAYRVLLREHWFTVVAAKDDLVFQLPLKVSLESLYVWTDTISYAKWLYSHINASALRLYTSRNYRFRMFTNCLSCALLLAFVFWGCVVERLNTCLK